VTVLETARLLLRPWTEADAEAMFPMFADPEVMRHWNAPPSASVEAMRAQIRYSTEAPPEVHAAWVVTLRPSGAAVGFVNYHHRDMRARRLEIGYLVARPHWRQGIAREAVAAFVTHCFDALQCYRVEATVDPANVASSRVLEVLGFRLEGGPMRARMWKGDIPLDAMMYGLLAPEWRARGA
jgi:[ribosomal protein S5]-alanine N-acetyltransferase